MTDIPASHEDLLQIQVATFATVGADGRPQLSAIWFLAEDGTIKVSLSKNRQKTKNLEHDPACTLFLLDLNNPYRYLEIRADAEIAEDPNYEFATKVGAKYNADLRAYDQPGDTRVVVTLHPVRVNAVAMG